MPEKVWTVYTIIERPGMERSFWVKIGRAFVNRDGSFNLILDALPINGKLHLREEVPRQSFAAGEDSAAETLAPTG